MNYFDTLDKSLCCGCTACASICPTKCITMLEDEDGFIYPDIDKAKCIDCGLCKKVCPFIHSETLKNNAADKCYALAVNDKDVLHKSASGGAFSAIMQAFCDQNYVIFGSEMCSDLVVRHTYADTIEEASKFKKSKYVKSDINNSYVHAREALDEGKKVLFTGTGCQIAGLRGFLQKEYDNLLTVDLVCHGVPSQKMFNNYINSLSKKYNAKVVNYSFREKHNGKCTYDKAVLENGAIHFLAVDNYYLRAFYSSISLMHSCHGCKFTDVKRTSDITIADFWGIELYNSKFDTNKGSSLLIINTQKGQKIFNEIKDVKLFDTDINNAIKGNGHLLKPTSLSPNKESFLKIARTDFPKAVKKYCKLSFKARIAKYMPSWMKQIIKKILRRA